MTIAKLVERYLKNTRQVFKQLEERKSLRERGVSKVLDHAERYLKDAIYYRDQRKFETALASVAYCEGLLDALRLLEMVEFQWTKENK